MPVPLAKRIEYARGYLALGLLNEAFDELEALEGEERNALDVLETRAELHLASKQWAMVIANAEPVARAKPTSEEAWINWAYALSELNQVEEAKAVLRDAEPFHGRTSSVLHYNLACYHCLLGELDEAKRRLKVACQMEKQWKTAAKTDPDLQALHAPPAK